MTEIKFLINKEDDVNIWYRFINKSLKSTNSSFKVSNYVPNHLIKLLKNKTEEEQRELISKYIIKNYTKENLDDFLITSKNKI
jgi:hypothetical protein